MTDKSNIGLTLYGVSGNPATNNKAGMESLTFVQLKGVIDIPVFGVTHNSIAVPDTATGFDGSVKGAASGKDVPFTYRGDGTDTGIATAIVAAGIRPGSFTLKIVVGTGADSGDGPIPVTGDVVQYAQGYLHNYEENAKNGTTFQGGSINFMQTAITVDDVEPS